MVSNDLQGDSGYIQGIEYMGSPELLGKFNWKKFGRAFAAVSTGGLSEIARNKKAMAAMATGGLSLLIPSRKPVSMDPAQEEKASMQELKSEGTAASVEVKREAMATQAPSLPSNIPPSEEEQGENPDLLGFEIKKNLPLILAVGGITVFLMMKKKKHRRKR